MAKLSIECNGFTVGKNYHVISAECGDFIVKDDNGNERRIGSDYFGGTRVRGYNAQGKLVSDKTTPFPKVNRPWWKIW